MLKMKRPEMKYANAQLVNAKVVMVFSLWQDIGGGPRDMSKIYLKNIVITFC